MSELSAISADGRFVAFSSTASNLVPTDSNSYTDVFVYEVFGPPPDAGVDGGLDAGTDAVIITNSRIARLHGSALRRSHTRKKITAHVITVPDSEKAKSIVTAQRVSQFFLS